MTDPANLITYMLKVDISYLGKFNIDSKINVFQELTATESRGFVDDNFLRYVGSKVTLETLYSEQDRLYNLGRNTMQISPNTGPCDNFRVQTILGVEI